MLKYTQTIPGKINAYLEDNGYNKANIARKICLEPDEFYAMLGNRRIMKADDLAKLCVVLGKSAEYLANYKRHA